MHNNRMVSVRCLIELSRLDTAVRIVHLPSCYVSRNLIYLRVTRPFLGRLRECAWPNVTFCFELSVQCARFVSKQSSFFILFEDVSKNWETWANKPELLCLPLSTTQRLRATRRRVSTFSPCMAPVQVSTKLLKNRSVGSWFFAAASANVMWCLRMSSFELFFFAETFRSFVPL